MRYIFIGVILLLGTVINSLLILPQISSWEMGSILIFDIGLIISLYTIKQYYWIRDYWDGRGRVKSAAHFVMWLGLIFAYMGVHTWASGDYHLTGSRAKTALYRDLMNAVGDTLGPWAVACIWLFLAVICFYYGWRGYRNA